ncbi:MAG: bacteriocin, partial [Gordonia sp. (in: high G+C Gram-positive bacteria)]
GYDSHNADTVDLYFIESFTYLNYTDEAAVPLR